jgi:alpha-tubulin suppressor-like RCC1 family protein
MTRTTTQALFSNRSLFASFFFAFAALMLANQSAWALSDGIAGRTNRDGGLGCANSACHGNQAADGGMSVIISGPTSLLPGAVGNYTVTSTRATIGAGVLMGVNIAASDGTLTEGLPNLIISGNEIVHSDVSSPLNTTNAGGSASYSFSYTMPSGAAPGSTRTLYAVSRLGFGGSWNHAANFTVTTATPPPVINSAATASGTVGSFFSYTITATNSPTSFNATSLPPGVTRSGATLSGTPTTAGTFNATISASNAGGTDTNALTITVSRGSQIITFPAQDPPGRTFVSGGVFSVNPLASSSSGLAVTYTSATPSVCTISGTTVTMVALGTCTIAADQAGNANYFPATTVQRSVALSNAAQFMLNTSPVATGNSHSCARRQDGTVQCWGDNEFGRVGAPIGGPRFISTPVTVSGLSGVVSLALGNEHSCALSSAGTVQCWGSGFLGQLGHGVFTNTANPVLVSNLNASAIALAGGGGFNCAVLTDGTVRCWGDNQFGTLGNGSAAASSSVPVTVSGINNAVAVASEGSHACVLRADNTVACWGSNAFGQLGVPSTTISGSNIPVAATVLDIPAIAIAVGSGFTCALTTRRGVKCWGVNLSGQLGGGTTGLSGGVTDVIGLSSGVATIAAGDSHACARLDDGSIRCWGSNTAGKLGDGTTVSPRTSPVNVTSLAATTIAETGAFVAAGGSQTCALMTSGRVRCWGGNSAGQLGNGTQTDSSVPVDVTGFTTIFASDTFSANDNFAGRSPLSGRYAFASTSNVIATDETGEPLHAGTSGVRSVWWSWTAPETRRFVLSTGGTTSTGATQLNTALAVYTGTSLATLAPVVSGTAAGGALGSLSRVTIDAVAGTTYQIAVDRATTGFGGRIVLSIVPAPGVTGDLSGDGKADLLVQLIGGGTTSALFMNGTSIAGIGTLEGGGGGWSVSHTGDFDGDGKADLFWRNSNGASTLWLMNGSTITASRGLLPPGSGWTVTHLGDFNGDGKADLLWRNDTDGSVTVWLMDGTNTLSAVGLLGGGSGWRVNHVGDLNGDGKADLMWRNDTDGSVTTWLMNGTSVTSAVGLLGGGSGWRVSHLADFNGDGKADLLWRNDIDGSVTVWLMDGASITSAVGLLGGSSWRVGPVGDLDGDGKADLIWRNDGLGITTVWLMNGTTVAASAGLLGDAAWRVVQLRDTNGDGKADLVWRNESGATTGSLVVWTMNGLTITGAAGITGPGFGLQ